jgi:hypothetical protein
MDCISCPAGQNLSSIAYYNVIYPFFCFEAKSPIGTNYAAANQLGGSLSFALGLLGQLRALATEDRNEPLLVFGATSSGRDFVVYVAYEADPLDGEMECVRRVIYEFHKPDDGILSCTYASRERFSTISGLGIYRTSARL